MVKVKLSDDCKFPSLTMFGGVTISKDRWCNIADQFLKAATTNPTVDVSGDSFSSGGFVGKETHEPVIKIVEVEVPVDTERFSDLDESYINELAQGKVSLVTSKIDELDSVYVLAAIVAVDGRLGVKKAVMNRFIDLWNQRIVATKEDEIEDELAEEIAEQIVD